MKSEIAERILEARKSKRLSQIRLANELGIARQTYIDLESGKTEPKVITLTKFAEITGISLNWLVFGAGCEELLYEEHEQEIRELVTNFTMLPLKTRSFVIKQAIDNAKFQLSLLTD